MSLDKAASILLAKKHSACDHNSQDVTEVEPGITHCWNCGKEWKK